MPPRGPCRQRVVAELAAGAADRPDVDESLVGRDPRRRDPRRWGTKPTRPNVTDGETTVNELPNTCPFATAPTLIASGEVAGDPAVPRPKKSRSLPAEITGTTPARTAFETASSRPSVLGSAWGLPPEKLITSIPSATAASKAATISGVFAEQQPPRGCSTLNTR